MSRSLPISILLTLVLTAMGCAESTIDADGADEADDGPVTEASSAITTLGTFTHQSTAAALPPNLPVDLGSDGDRTCFLQGVTGEFLGEQFGAQARARVFQSNGHWWLQTFAGIGSGVRGHATCIPNTYHRQLLSWFGNTQTSTQSFENKSWLPMDSVNATTRCFLTEVSATVGFLSPNAWLALKRETITWAGNSFSTWSMGGGLVTQQDGSRGGFASAVCLDMAVSITPYSFESSAGSGGVSTVISPLSERVCSVTRLQGHLASATFGIGDGLKVFASGDDWRAFSSAGNRIDGECYGDLNIWF